MRIATITPVYPPYKGGIGNVAYHYSNMLRKRGHNVTVFTPGYTKDLRRSNEQDLHVLQPIGTYGNAAFVPQLFFSLKGYDIVHAHIPFIGASGALIVYKLLHPKIRLVVHYHMDLLGKGILAPIFSLYRMIVIRVLLMVADSIIVTSQDYADTSVFQNYFKNCSSKLHVLANGIIFDLFSKPKPQTVTKRHLPYVLFVGGLDKAHYFKGVSILIKAWEKLNKKFKVYNLILVGDGDMRLRYEKEASKIDAHDQIHFVGKISDDDLVEYFQNAAVTVLPSLNSGEAFGMVLIESMAANTPVVASKLPGVRTLITDGGNGFLTESGSPEKLIASIETALSRSATIKAAHTLPSTAKKYDWGKLTNILEKILEGK